jgi:hypothetical protein
MKALCEHHLEVLPEPSISAVAFHTHRRLRSQLRKKPEGGASLKKISLSDERATNLVVSTFSD